MMQSQILTPSLETIGEDIGQELGAKMVKDFQDVNPNEISAYFVGRNIIDKILNQPNCVGIRFYCALNELGEKTFVYVGVDNNEEIIAEYSGIGQDGKLEKYQGIVADRVKPGGGKTETTWVWSL